MNFHNSKIFFFINIYLIPISFPH